MIYDQVSGSLSAIDQMVVDHVPPGGNWRNLPADFPSKRVEQIRRTAANGEGSRSTYYGRLRSDRPAYTISTYFSRPGNGCFIHPEADRLITVREAARLQTFPDSYRFSGRGRARYMQVGNAVPPLLAYQMARMIPPGPVVDLFSGAGGMSLGFEWAGFKLAAAVDVDKSAIETMRLNGVPADRATVADLSNDAEVRRVAAQVNDRLDVTPAVVIGGPPCQGFSTAGRWDRTDPRNRLVFAFLDVIAAVRPAYVVMENVPALLWKRGKPTLDKLRRLLEELGYSTSAAILHAEAFGAPQLRRRLFLVASREGAVDWPAPIRAISQPAYPSMQPGASTAPSILPVTVGEAISDLPFELATDADTSVGYAGPPSSEFQRWARGEISAEAFCGPAQGLRGEEQLSLVGAP